MKSEAILDKRECREPAHLARAAHAVHEYAMRESLVVFRQQQQLHELHLHRPVTKVFKVEARKLLRWYGTSEIVSHG